MNKNAKLGAFAAFIEKELRDSFLTPFVYVLAGMFCFVVGGLIVRFLCHIYLSCG